MITFSRITDPSHLYFDKAFALYATSFPQYEQRLSLSQRRILSHPQYHCDVILSDNRFCGILFYWEINQLCYVEHFAILSSLRGQGIGSQAIKIFLQQHPHTLLEIDPPIDDISCRRKQFYTSLGFVENPYSHLHPPYRPHFMSHPLLVMSFPDVLLPQEYQSFASFLKDVVMDSVF